MNNAWDHLPNAKHIDKVLAHLETCPHNWNLGYSHRTEAWAVDWNIAVRCKATWDVAERKKAWRSIRLESAQGVVLALIAHDNCAYMLDFTPEQIHLYACMNIPGAALLRPAIIAMNQ